MKRLAFPMIALLSTLAGAAFAGVCQKPTSENPGDLKSCYQSPRLRWALDMPPNMTASDIQTGPRFEPALTAAEIESKTVFCQYFFHEFSSPGSAKFMCAKTNALGQLYDKKGEIVPEAARVATRSMKLKVNLNGKTVKVDEGVLLDANQRPLVRTTAKGKQELIEADELKVKYFVDSNQYSEKKGSVQRRDVTLKFDGGTITFKDAFDGPYEVSNPRWNEVFTEVAATRLLWAIGFPADIMIPMNHLVCFGCETHPMVQKEIKPGKVSVYHRVALEKKMKGTKLDEQFSVNQLLKENLPQWSASTNLEMEQLAIAARLIAYHNAIPLQNRMQCLPGQFDKETSQCQVPVAFVQDVGSSWAGEANDEERKAYNGSNPRGALNFYKRERVFASAHSCSLFRAFGSEDKNELKRYPVLVKSVSAQGLAEFQRRIGALTPSVMEAIFQVSHFGDMEPRLRDQAPGATLQDKRQYIVQQWVQALQSRVDEVKNAHCTAASMEVGK